MKHLEKILRHRIIQNWISNVMICGIAVLNFVLGIQHFSRHMIPTGLVLLCVAFVSIYYVVTNVIQYAHYWRLLRDVKWFLHMMEKY